MTAGLLTSPDRDSTPKPAPAPIEVGERADRPMEPPSGYQRRTQPFLDWPEAPAERPVLTWPPSGCDAGMWSIEYEVEQIDWDRTFVRVPSKPDVNAVAIHHGNTRDVEFYPVAPNLGWAIVTPLERGGFIVQRLENGEPTCSLERDFHGAEVRAVADEGGILVYGLGDEHEWSVVQLDDTCSVVGERAVPATLARPAKRTFQLEVAAERGSVRHALIGDRQIVLSSPDFASSVTFEAGGPIQALDYDATDDAVWLIYWDRQTTHLKVLEHDGTVRWEDEFTMDLLRQPISHVALEDGMLSVRGPLDSYRQHKDLVRVFDTRDNAIIGEGRGNLLDSTPMVWRPPPPLNPSVLLSQSSVLSTDWTSCAGLEGWTYLDALPCDGERVSRSVTHEGGQTIVQLTSDLRGERATCGVTVDASDEELHSVSLEGGVLTVLATGRELRGWQFDFDCVPLRETRLPAQLLQPREGLSAPELETIAGESSIVLSSVEDNVVLEPEARPMNADMWTTLKLEPSARPITRVEVLELGDGDEERFVAVRGALDTPPWSTERDRVRAYDMNGDEVLVVDAPDDVR